MTSVVFGQCGNFLWQKAWAAFSIERLNTWFGGLNLFLLNLAQQLMWMNLMFIHVIHWLRANWEHFWFGFLSFAFVLLLRLNWRCAALTFRVKVARQTHFFPQHLQKDNVSRYSIHAWIWWQIESSIVSINLTCQWWNTDRAKACPCVCVRRSVSKPKESMAGMKALMV